MADYSLPRIKESALPEATNVDKVRVLDSTGKSVWVEKEDLPITETQVTGLTDDLALKADKSVEIIAGAGLTGGGDLSAERTFNVVSADDGITVNANDIKLNIVNNLTTSSATRALSATQGKKLQDEKEALSNKSTDIVADAASTTKYPSVKLIKDYADSLHPELALYTRWLADTGTQLDEEMLLKAYADYLNNLPETEFLFCPQIASKNRTSGLNQYVNTIYDLGEEENDAVQATEATQPYLGGYIAPNENRYLKFVSGQTQTGLLDFTDVVFAATDSWTLMMVIKPNSKKNWSQLLLSTNSTLEISSSSINLISAGTTIMSCSNSSINVSKTNYIEFSYSNGQGLIKINGAPIITTVLSGAIRFGQISYHLTNTFDGTIYAYHLTNTRKSAYQSQLDHQFLSLLFPDIESIAIGNQVWATSNFDGIVAGDGTVIPEVQGATTDGNTEVCTNGTFETDLTGWSASTGNTISRETDGSTYFLRGTYGTNSGGIGAYFTPSITTKAGYIYRIKFKAKSPNLTTSITHAGASGNTLYAVSNPALSTTWQNYEFYFVRGLDNLLRVYTSSNIAGATLDIDDVSVKEVGASDSTIVYNYVYAATSGSAAVKDLAATKAAAMWCHYNNSAANGAVYGKLYNWYAVHLFDIVGVVRGWRIPSKADFDQLVANQGGSTVAGGRLKAKFGGLDNVFANNESGLSGIGSSRRDQNGIFADLGTRFQLFSSSQTNADHSSAILLSSSDASSLIDGFSIKARFLAIRPLRNEPAGANELSYTSGLFTTDITSAAKQIPISFGRMVDAISIKSENALTAIEAKLHNAAGTAVATLITGKSVSAGATMVFPVSADYAALLQDGTVRVTASGNSGAAVGMEIQVLTHKSVL